MLPHTGLFLLWKVALQMRIRLRLKSVVVFSDDLCWNGSGLKVRRKAKRSSENLISKFSDDLLFKPCLLVGFITFEGKEDDVEVAHGRRNIRNHHTEIIGDLTLQDGNQRTANDGGTKNT